MKYAFVLPVAATAMAAFARPEISQQMAEISSAKITDLSRMVQTAVAEMPRSEAVDTTTTPKEVTVVGYAQLTDKVYESAEVMPEFPGGQAELLKFVAKSIKYPTEAQRKGAQGRVIVKFVVEKNGSISNIHVVKGLDPLLDAEAIRVCTTMPTWAPAQQEGKAVRCYYTIPVTYSLMKAVP